tara:strand:- start:337 stop:678 length:342 start_codon:yes stop_codon:yes gene_type:complete
MAKRIAVGTKKKGGLKFVIDGKLVVVGPGELVPQEAESQVRDRFFRDRRVVWVEVKEKSKPKPSPSKTKKETAKTKSASPSPSSEGAGASAPAPLEVKAEEGNAKSDKPKRKQ